MNRTKQEPRVVIIGAGVGGLTYAIALKRQFGFENFTTYEKADEVGGCWRANTYPGCSSDVEIHWYSLSSDLNPNWNKPHGLQPEIQEYWIGLSQKYQLYPHLVFNTKVISAEWDSSANHYNILVEDILTGKRMTSTAEIVISAVGVLEIPNIPYEMSGIQKFEGISFHSAEWPRGLDLRHKRVAVVGNASSGAQFVPFISADPSVDVVNFIRTPVLFNTRLHTPYSDTEKWIFANIAFAMRLHRAYIMFKVKRTLANSGYLASLSRPNLTLNFDGIAEIVENGIVTKKGDLLPFDVIIYATGFRGDKYPVHVTGLHGITVQGYYDAHGGPTAYHGTAIPNIPNFYMLAGPNTGTPTSTLFVEEVSYSLQLVKLVLDGLVSSFTVKADATDAYNAKLQERISRSVHTQCYSWQRTGGTGKVFDPFPWPVTLWWWWLRQPNWAHYNVTGADKWVRRRSENIRYALKALVPAFLFGVYVRRTTLIPALYENVCSPRWTRRTYILTLLKGHEV
ncbi:hypothetical protein PAXINDRAFT_72805 [Paxillus involutus ATCC 200175]|nr:hypothetical protein PAXINDRAFT_72805 [Paxillus involutus ATCC 200175]